MVTGMVLAALASACGSNPTPTSPGPIVLPPPDPEPPPPPPAPPTLSIARVLSFGDSMTAGTTSPTYVPFRLTAGLSQSYPYKLQALLTQRYSAQAVMVANAGRAGENVADSRTRDRFADALSEAMPQVAILMEGANDLNSLREGMSNVTPIMGAMEDLVRDATGRGVQVFLATIPPQRPGQKNTQHADLVGKYNAELKVMASKKGATIIDVNALLPLSFIGQDGLHPTEEGYGRLAEIFLNAIRERYEVATIARPPAGALPRTSGSR